MDNQLLAIAHQALMVTVIVTLPPVLAAMVIGLALAVIQALTQLQEQTLTLAFKIAAVFGTLYFFGYWMAGQITRFAELVFTHFGTWVR